MISKVVLKFHPIVKKKDDKIQQIIFRFQIYSNVARFKKIVLFINSMQVVLEYTYVNHVLKFNIHVKLSTK